MYNSKPVLIVFFIAVVVFSVPLIALAVEAPSEFIEPTIEFDNHIHIDGSAINFYGRSTLTENACLQTQLYIDGEPVTGWPLKPLWTDCLAASAASVHLILPDTSS